MLPFSLSYILAALVLLCAFLQISQRRLQPMIKLSQFSAFFLSFLMLWQAVFQKEWLLCFCGILVVLIQAWAFPYVLSRMINKFSVQTSAKHALPMVWSMLIALLFVCVAIVVGTPQIKTPLPSEAGIMAVALSVAVLGICQVIIHSQALAQIIGALTLANGLMLALVGMCMQGFIIFAIVIALLGVVACMIFLASEQYAERVCSLENGADL